MRGVGCHDVGENMSIAITNKERLDNGTDIIEVRYIDGSRQGSAVILERDADGFFVPTDQFRKLSATLKKQLWVSIYSHFLGTAP